MTFVVTAIGDELDVRYPAPGHLTAPTIAWALSQVNRFNGHANRPYSVAEHSLLVCEIAERELGLGVHGQLLALMHDAHEAFIGDVATPMKREIGEDWARHEERWERLVHRTYSLQMAAVSYAAKVKEADLLALASERQALLPRTPTAWHVLDHVEPLPWAVTDLSSPERRTHDWEFWRDRWLDRYHELDFARNALHHPVAQP